MNAPRSVAAGPSKNHGLRNDGATATIPTESEQPRATPALACFCRSVNAKANGKRAAQGGDKKSKSPEGTLMP